MHVEMDYAVGPLTITGRTIMQQKPFNYLSHSTGSGACRALQMPLL